MWIELLNISNQERVGRCVHVVELARKGTIELWTSAFTLVEVWKRRCGPTSVSLTKEQDRGFEDLIEQDYVKIIDVNYTLGQLARRLLREHPGLGKPQDAVHVASCLMQNIDVLQTFDARDLLKFDSKLKRGDGEVLRICQPPKLEELPLIPDSEMGRRSGGGRREVT